MTVTRFAPSPTGHLHLGHAYSAFFASDIARRENGTFLLRIEDIDPVRCKPQFTADLLEDLAWLGLQWPEPVRLQSQHSSAYRAALDRLRALDAVYPCFCTRKEVRAEAQAAAHAPHGSANGTDGPIYPGTCRHLSRDQRAEKLEKGPANWRLDAAKAEAVTGPLVWHDRVRGDVPVATADFGDVVLARKDIFTSYHLSVAVDDALQGVTLVTRGEDLAPMTGIHRILQALLGYAAPGYHHHPLVRDKDGRRYAKRDNATTLRSLRAEGKTAGELRALIGF